MNIFTKLILHIKMQDFIKQNQIYIIIPKSAQQHNLICDFAEKVVKKCIKNLHIKYSLLLDEINNNISILSLKTDTINVNQIQQIKYKSIISNIFVNSDNFVCINGNWNINNQKFNSTPEKTLLKYNILNENLLLNGNYFPAIGNSIEENTPSICIFIPKSMLI
jgi:hypothetical protein